MKKMGVIIGVLATILTARMGVFNNPATGMTETWYNLKMNKVVERADAYYGLSDVFEIREDGVKTYNGFVILAADKSVPYGTVVETSRGIGIVLDYHTVKNGKNLYDVAVDWQRGGKK